MIGAVSGFESALKAANDIEYGLSSAVFTSDLSKAMDFVRRTESGVVHVNRETAGVEPHVPFGGIKASSSMHREHQDGLSPHHVTHLHNGLQPACRQCSIQTEMS